MAYTPELEIRDSQTLRRVAWALGMPMTKTMSEIFRWLSQNLDPAKVCGKCRDKSKCEDCLFNR
jgi:hypothetical protein